MRVRARFHGVIDLDKFGADHLLRLLPGKVAGGGKHGVQPL